jgi:hypothetical protein
MELGFMQYPTPLYPIPHGTARPSATNYNPSGGCRRAGAVVEGVGCLTAKMLLGLIRLL